MGMGGRHIIHLPHTLMPQKWCDDALADIDIVPVGTAAVDQHRRAFWEANETGIPVPYIEKGDLELTAPGWKEPGPGEPGADHEGPAHRSPERQAMMLAIGQQHNGGIGQQHDR